MSLGRTLLKSCAIIHLTIALICFIIVEFELPVDIIGLLSNNFNLSFTEVKHTLQVVSVISLLLFGLFLFAIFPDSLEKSKN